MNNIDGEKELAKLKREIASEFHDFVIVGKSGSLTMKTIDILLRILTLNQMKTFMTKFVTTLGSKVFVPETWFNRTHLSRCATLRHERVHMRQRERMGRVLYTFTYLLWAFPTVFAVGRRDLEMEAYKESMRAYAEYFGLEMLTVSRVKKNMVKHFTSSSYFWMWPFSSEIEAWYDVTRREVVEEIKQWNLTSI